MERSEKAEAWVRERVAANQCLTAGCCSVPSRRGLCDNHWAVFYRMHCRKSTADQKRFFRSLYDIGAILKPGEIADIRAEQTLGVK